ncbi:MAG: tyrosine recombinase XerC [Puniceicoccales bacterium]|nr:tyrosine recombinase XerC [Puniceicoccales bacterium]
MTAQFVPSPVLATFPGADLVAQFVCLLRDERRVSPCTIRNYQQALRDFCLWAKKNGGFAGDFKKLSRRLVRDFVIEKQRVLSRATLQNHLSALRAFYRFLLRRRVAEFSPLAGLRSPRLERRLPRFLTEPQMAKLLAMPGVLHDEKRIGEWERLRDEAVLECLYGAGLRVSELCGLDYAHVEFESGLVRVLGKGSRERVVPVGRVACEAIRRLRSVSPRPEGSPDAVFTTARKQRLYPRAVQLLMKRYLERAGLPGDLTPHKLRHTCATHLLNHDAGLRIIQEQLGHASLSTTQIYTHVSLARLKRIHSAAHPRA